MRQLADRMRRFIEDERGTETLEWGLICGLIVASAIAAVAMIAHKVAGMWGALANAMDSL